MLVHGVHVSCSSGVIITIIIIIMLFKYHAQYRDSDSLQIETMMFDNSFASYPIVSYYGGTVWFEAHVVGPCADSTAQFGEM